MLWQIRGCDHGDDWTFLLTKSMNRRLECWHPTATGTAGDPAPCESSPVEGGKGQARIRNHFAKVQVASTLKTPIDDLQGPSRRRCPMDSRTGTMTLPVFLVDMGTKEPNISQEKTRAPFLAAVNFGVSRPGSPIEVAVPLDHLTRVVTTTEGEANALCLQEPPWMMPSGESAETTSGQRSSTNANSGPHADAETTSGQRSNTKANSGQLEDIVGRDRAVKHTRAHTRASWGENPHVGQHRSAEEPPEANIFVNYEVFGGPGALESLLGASWGPLGGLLGASWGPLGGFLAKNRRSTHAERNSEHALHMQNVHGRHQGHALQVVGG